MSVSEAYERMKDQSMTVMANSGKYLKEYGSQSDIAILGKIRKSVAEDQLVIMTVGETRQGKSSMLGMLLADENLFPVDVGVTTCIITVACYAPEEKITLVLTDDNGREFSKCITRDQIPDYAKEQNRKSNGRQATMMLIATPNPVLKQGFTFIDSPGIGSLNPRHSQLTYQFLPRADAVLYVSDCLAPMSDTEISFLKSVHNGCESIVYVLTKSDRTEDTSSIIQVNRANIEKHVGIPGSAQIHVPVSSFVYKQYISTGKEMFREESGFMELKRVINDSIQSKRPSIVLLPRLQEVESMLKRSEQTLIVEEVAYSDSETQRQSLIAELTTLQALQKKTSKDGASWQDTAKDGIDDIGAAMLKGFSQYIDEAKKDLNEKIKQPCYLKEPTLLRNEVISQTERKLSDLSGQAIVEIEQLRTTISKKVGLDLVIDKQNLQLVPIDGSDISVSEQKKMKRVSDFGKQVKRSAFGLGGFGSVVGGLLGGVVGLFTGGPIGVVYGVILGASAGGTVGGAVGSAKGALDAIKMDAKFDMEQLRQKLQTYLDLNLKEFKDQQKTSLRDIQRSFKNQINDSIQQRYEKNSDDIAILKNAVSKDAASQAQSRTRIANMRNALTPLLGDVAALIKATSEPIDVTEVSPVEVIASASSMPLPMDE